jgi:hypothetical protein
VTWDLGDGTDPASAGPTGAIRGQVGHWSSAPRSWADALDAAEGASGASPVFVVLTRRGRLHRGGNQVGRATRRPVGILAGETGRSAETSPSFWRRVRGGCRRRGWRRRGRCSGCCPASAGGGAAHAATRPTCPRSPWESAAPGDAGPWPS